MTPRTVVRVERGDPTVGIGICFDLAVLCGVALFGTDRAGLARQLSESRHRVTLLPASARPRRPAADDEF